MLPSTAAIIMAGGANKHLNILSEGKSTPSLRIGGYLKLIDFTLSNCVDSGIETLNLITDSHSRQLWPYLRHWHKKGSGNYEVRIFDSGSGDYSGTADCLNRQADLIKQMDHESILVLSSDKVYRMNYDLLYQHHNKTEADVTIGVVPVPLEDSLGTLSIFMNAEGRVSHKNESRSDALSSFALVPMGAYLIKKRVLLEHLEADAACPTSAHSLKTSLLPQIIQENKTYAVPFTGYWRDIRTLGEYYLANMEYLAQKPGRPNYGNMTAARNPFSLRTAATPYTTGNVRSSIIDEGCEIEGYVENSIIAGGVHVRRHAEIWDSIILGEGEVAKYSVIDHCIIGKNVKIGEQCYIGLGAISVNGHSNITIIGDNVCIPPYTSIGRDCRIMPGSGPEEFVSGVISPGTILHKQTVLMNAALSR